MIVTRKLDFSAEEKEILRKAWDIINEVNEDLQDNDIEEYENSAYITDIIDLVKEFNYR